MKILLRDGEARLSGKTAFVTGAGQGIGRAICEHFHREGAVVIGADINQDTLRDLSSRLNIDTQILDVTNRVDVATAAEQFSDVNVLVNCSGVVAHGTVLDCSDSDWDRCFDVNARAIYYTTAAFLPRMRERGNGSIINIASIVSSLHSAANRFAYGASKGAVLGITKSIAVDFVAEGIRCNAICPGTIDSPSLQERLKSTGNYEQALRDFEERQPMKRLGSVEEIAAIASLLASDECPFMTGSEVVVDGGWSA
jgi:2-keto-3-deoxy-L-fuconate dehydrogenase